MTHPPHDPSNLGPFRAPEPAYGSGYARDYDPARDYGYDARPTDGAPVPQEPAAERSRTRRRIAIGAAVAGVLALAGGGYAVASFLSGGGAQPEEVLPADTVAFVRLDLDPAMGQKTAMASLLEKFPALGDGSDDIRQGLVDELLRSVGSDLVFEQDVAPWLGDRMAVAAVRDDGSEMGIAPVLVLAVTDEQAMSDALDSARDDLGLGFAVRDDFVLVTESQETADRLAAEESRLSEDADYTGDREALGGDQIAVAWTDLSAFEQLMATALGEEVPLGLAGQAPSGRIVVGLHAEDAALELEGLQFSVSDVGVGPHTDEPTRLVQDLPKNTLAAFSASGAGDSLVQQWDQLEATGMFGGIQDQLPGLDLPDDLRTIFGTDFVVAWLSSVQNPQFGARVVTDDGQRATDVVNALLYTFGAELDLAEGSVDDGYVLASDAATARALEDDGSLGETDAFRAAVPEADTSVATGYVDLDTILDQVPDSGTDGVQPSDFAAVEAFGFSSEWTDEGSRFRLRITTD